MYIQKLEKIRGVAWTSDTETGYDQEGIDNLNFSSADWCPHYFIHTWTNPITHLQLTWYEQTYVVAT